MRWCLGLLLLGTAPLAAQEEPFPWRVSDFPYLMGDPTNGLLVIGHAQYAREADYDARIPFDGYIGLEAAWGTRSSRFLVAKFRAPALYPGWRLAADAGAVREGKFGYYGQGPDGESPLAASDPEVDSDFFRVHRTRYYARGEVTRKLFKQIRAAAAVGIVQYKYAAPENGDMFRTDFFDQPLSGSDATARLALVLDTRNTELLPTTGVLLEAGVYGGSGKFERRLNGPGGGAQVSEFSGGGYTGAYTHLRGYFSVRPGTVLAARLGMRGLSGNAPLDARYMIPGWERELTVYGGADTHRSFVRGRFVGRGVLFSSFEVRHTVIDVGDYGAVVALAFLDAGRTFDGAPRVTLRKWTVGAGGGLAIKVVRSALLTLNFAGGPDGFTFSMGNAWSF